MLKEFYNLLMPEGYSVCRVCVLVSGFTLGIQAGSGVRVGRKLPSTSGAFEESLYFTI